MIEILRICVQQANLIYELPVMLLVVLTGITTFFIDGGQMKAKNLNRERMWARTIGLIYIVGGISLRLLLIVLSRYFSL